MWIFKKINLKRHIKSQWENRAKILNKILIEIIFN